MNHSTPYFFPLLDKLHVSVGIVQFVFGFGLETVGGPRNNIFWVVRRGGALNPLNILFHSFCFVDFFLKIFKDLPAPLLYKKKFIGCGEHTCLSL